MHRKGSLLLLLCLFCVAMETTLGLFDEDQVRHLWQRFKARHGKRYEDTEDKTRRETFREHLHLITEHNVEADLGEHQFTLGLNEFADWSRDEYKKFLTGFRPSRTPSAAEDAEPSLLSATPASLPTSVNWVNRGWVTPVKNQGQCGSCYTFATTGALEGQLFNKTQNLVSLSEQNLVDCSTTQGNQGCNGGVTDWCFKYVIANGGIDTEASYPYTGTQGSCQYKASNSAATCKGWVDIPKGNELALQQAVATVGPVAIAIDASSVWFQLYRGGVYSSSSCSSTNIDHAVLAVGYGVTSSNQAYWYIKNSWGTSWGSNGYMQMARNQNNMCGVATQASYPTM